jgi:hypothetical protein
MGSISGVSGMSNAWTQVSTQRSQMQAQLFTQVDSNGSVDKSGLDPMRSDLSEMTGTTQDTNTLLETMDGNSDDGLSSDALTVEVMSLMTASTSTLDFADQRSEPSDAVDETDMQALTNKMTYEQASSDLSTTRGNTLSITA